MVVYVAAGAVALGLATVLVMTLGGSVARGGVAHSLALIGEGAGAHRGDVARNDQPAFDRLVKPVFDFGRRLALRLTPSGAIARLRRLVDFAGNPGDWSVERVLALKGVALLVGAFLGLLMGHLTLGGIVLACALGAGLFYVPDLLVYNLGLHRQEELRLGLADALDMLTVCVEAGQAFDGAMQQVAQSVTGPVAGEFSRVLREIAIGRSRGDAFASMAERTTVPEIKTFITAMIQADRMGLSIGNVLREQAEQMRLVRRQRAEEKAQKVPVKIMVPMVLCIFPIMFVVLIGPGAMRIMGVFGGGGI